MVMSMTGYGRAEGGNAEIKVAVEIKSVNHRYFDFSVKTPRGCAFLDDKLKTLANSRISRGKIDMYVSIDTSAFSDAAVEANLPLAESYIKSINAIKEEFGLENNMTAYSIARLPDVLSVTRTEMDEDLVWSLTEQTASEAIDRFIAMRAVEGEKLKDDVLSRLDSISEMVSFIERQEPKTVEAYRERLYAKLKEVLEDKQIDEARLITEAALFADKIAVDEETVRLRSHIKQVQSLLSGNEPVGRKLDFIVQEMNRETNTIGSKSQNIDVAHKVVDIKSEIEKIREQIQNME